MVTISACYMNLPFQYGATFGESLSTIAHHDELQLCALATTRTDPVWPALDFPGSVQLCTVFPRLPPIDWLLMAVIWLDEFEDGRMESPIRSGLYEQRQIKPTEHAMKRAVYERLWQELLSLRDKLCRSQ